MSDNKKFSYSGNPSNSTKDETRFHLGDTDVNRPLLGDDEIKYLLAQYGSPLLAAAAGAIALAAKFTRACDESVGSVSKSYSQRAEAFRTLAKDLQKRSTLTNCLPYAGGISKTDKAANEENTDRVDNTFYRDLHNIRSFETNKITEEN